MATRSPPLQTPDRSCPAMVTGGSSLQSLLRLLRNGWKPILLFTVLVPAVTVALTVRQQNVYSASVDVLVNRANLDTTIVGAPGPNDPADRVMTTLAQLARSTELLQTVARSVPDMSATSLEQDSQVQSISDADILRFTTRASTAATAHDAAQRYAQQFVAFVKGPDALTVRSELPAEKVGPRPLRNGLLAAIGGLLIGVGVALALELVDPHFTSPSQIAEALGLPLLARLSHRRDHGRGSGPVALVAPEGVAAQRVRGFAVTFDRAARRAAARKVIFTSAVPGNGKSVVVADLGVALARAGHRVTLVDLDISHPTLATQFQVDEKAPGVTDVAGGDCSLDAAAVEIDVSRTVPRPSFRGLLSSRHRNGRLHSYITRVDPSVPLRFVPAGTYTEVAEGMLDGPAIREILDALAQSSDLVLVDVPPSLVLPGSLSLYEAVDATVIVARRASARQRALSDLRQALPNLPESLGVVVVDSSSAEDQELRGAAASVAARSEQKPAPGSFAARTPTT